MSQCRDNGKSPPVSYHSSTKQNGPGNADPHTAARPKDRHKQGSEISVLNYHYHFYFFYWLSQCGKSLAFLSTRAKPTKIFTPYPEKETTVYIVDSDLYCGRVMVTLSSFVLHTLKYATNTELASNLPCCQRLEFKPELKTIFLNSKIFKQRGSSLFVLHDPFTSWATKISIDISLNRDFKRNINDIQQIGAFYDLPPLLSP